MLMPNPVSDARALATIRADYQSWYDRPHEYVPSTPGGGCATCGYGLGAFFHNSFEVQRHMEAQNIHVKAAALLFNVPEDQVTAEQVERARGINKTPLFAADHPRRATSEMIRERLQAEPDAKWAKCPDCKQSATGKYLGKFGCSRCGWQEGVTDRRKVFI